VTILPGEQHVGRQFGLGDVAGDGVGMASNQRNGSIAVVNTCLAMSMISKVPENRSRLQAIQQNQLLVPEWSSGQIALPGADLFMGFSGDGATDIQYVPGMHVKYQSNQYVASSTFPTNGNPTPAPGAIDPAPWIDETKTQNPAPLLVDGWNNPIIFVPATGLKVRLLNGKTSFDKTDMTQNWIIVSPEGKVDSNGTAAPQVTTPGRPFWASAGPDGDFSKGDDNIYSFEK